MWSGTRPRAGFALASLPSCSDDVNKLRHAAMHPSTLDNTW
jgi:hypothetical protein